MGDSIEMTGVREYAEEMPVKLQTNAENGRLVIKGVNEAGFNHVEIDLVDLIAWLRENRGDLLDTSSA